MLNRTHAPPNPCEPFMSNFQTVFIGLCNPKAPSNVGSVMRAARCYQANAVRYTGERFSRAAKFHTDTKSTESKISLIRVNEILDDLPNDMEVVCVEFAEGATRLSAFAHPPRAIYIFGPEDGSIPQHTIDNASSVVYVPTIGCMNLAATVNVLLYDRLSKSDTYIDDDDRIKSSRDTNNRLIVNPGLDHCSARFA